MSFLLTHNHLRLTERILVVSRLPSILNGLTIVQLSDLHFYEYSSDAFFERVTACVNELNPDVLLLTGDVIHYGSDFVSKAGAFLSGLRSKEQKLAILGNHDYNDGAMGGNVREICSQTGFHLLQNTSYCLSRADQEGQTYSLWFAGLDDLWYGQPDIHRALQGIPPEDPVIMLIHNPLLFDPITKVVPERVDLVLAGHTHAGHVYIPILGPIYRRLFRMKYRYGHYIKNGCQMVVSSGIGSAAFYLKKQKIGLPPFRWNTYPEIVLTRLTNGQ